VADIYNGVFSVEGTTVTHVPSGASWTFNFNSPNPYRSSTKSLGRPLRLTFAGIAKGIWALHLRTKRGATGVANSFISQATV
jgi:hypothetical protein